MGSIKRKLARQNKSADNFFTATLPLLAQNQALFDSNIPLQEIVNIYNHTITLLDETKEPLPLIIVLRRIAAYKHSDALCIPARTRLAFYVLQDCFRDGNSTPAVLRQIHEEMLAWLSAEPDNPLPVAAIVHCLFYEGDYEAAADLVLKQADTELQTDLLATTFANMALVSRLDFLTSSNPELTTSFERILERQTADSEIHLHIAIILGELYIHRSMFLQAFQLYSQLKAPDNILPLIATKLGEVCWYLDRPTEAEGHYRRVIELLRSADAANENIGIDEAEFSLAVLLCEQGRDLAQARAIFEKQLLTNKTSNPLYHNLAMCLHLMEDYNASIGYCRKALKIASDETTLALVAKNFQALRQFGAAIEWYGKALLFIDSLDTNFSINHNGQKSFSFSRPEWLEEKKREIYSALITCHIELGETDIAACYLRNARSWWPQDSLFGSLQSSLNLIVAANNAAAKAATKATIEQLATQLAARFPQASAQTIDFLSTGELLYNAHSKDDMDYSPLLLQYAKAFENELMLCLQSKNVLAADKRYTLGELVQHIEPYCDAKTAVHARELLKHRNRAVHKGRTDSATLQSVRNGLLNKGWLEAVLRLKA